jgi:hypothetical protein
VKKLIPILAVGYLVYALFVALSLGQTFLHLYHTYLAGVSPWTGREWAPLAVLTSASGIRLVLLLCVAYFLFSRSHRIAALVIAGICCIAIPIGTVLGGVTIYALTRPEIRSEFTRIV